MEICILLVEIRYGVNNDIRNVVKVLWGFKGGKVFMEGGIRMGVGRIYG